MIINQLLIKEMNQFVKVKKYVMDEESSHDIDTPFDWEVAQVLLLHKN